ncbi:MAG TPA: DUF4159 domain-containing protein [Vicinamibacterales bacterium]|nr:DUF4159 domain-containing protein [Vicinamibacterales bacterium]
MIVRTVRVVRVVLVVLLAGAGVSAAQFQRALSFGERVAAENDFDGRFNFCRLVYDGNRNGGSWRTDFPAADVNMSIRFSELTKTRVAFYPSGEPKHVLVRATSPTLFKCPLVIMTAPGSAIFDPEEAAALRLYLAKGGFLWADDFWGSDQWEQWEFELRKVLPAAEHPIVELPVDHPIRRSQFVFTEIPQIPNIGYYRRSGGDTSERGYDSQVPTARIINDDLGRVMVLMTHNTDISDSWEREGEDASYFYAFSPKGYAVGINVLLYALTH